MHIRIVQNKPTKQLSLHNWIWPIFRVIGYLCLVTLKTTFTYRKWNGWLVNNYMDIHRLAALSQRLLYYTLYRKAMYLCHIRIRVKQAYVRIFAKIRISTKLRNSNIFENKRKDSNLRSIRIQLQMWYWYINQSNKQKGQYSFNYLSVSTWR